MFPSFLTLPYPSFFSILVPSRLSSSSLRLCFLPSFLTLPSFLSSFHPGSLPLLSGCVSFLPSSSVRLFPAFPYLSFFFILIPSRLLSSSSLWFCSFPSFLPYPSFFFILIPSRLSSSSLRLFSAFLFY
jgi:hypothetical protein